MDRARGRTSRTKGCIIEAPRRHSTTRKEALAMTGARAITHILKAAGDAAPRVLL